MSVIGKARAILKLGKIRTTHWTDNINFEVEGEKEVYMVRLFWKNDCLHWSCSCPYMGIKGTANNSPCSHVLAAIGSLLQVGK